LDKASKLLNIPPNTEQLATNTTTVKLTHNMHVMIHIQCPYTNIVKKVIVMLQNEYGDNKYTYLHIDINT